jgi:hypothetical protein
MWVDCNPDVRFYWKNLQGADGLGVPKFLLIRVQFQGDVVVNALDVNVLCRAKVMFLDETVPQD